MKEFRILFALANDALQAEIAARLEKYYTIRGAENAEAVTDAIHEFQPQLAIIDYALADVNPIEIDEGLKFLHPDTKIVLCVTDENLEVASRIWHKRAIDYIRKPLDIDHMEDDVNKIVRHLLDQVYKESLAKKLNDLEVENEKLKRML